MNDELELLNGLKPCPFCGKHSAVLRREQVPDSSMTLYAVRCYRCGAEGPKVCMGDDSSSATQTVAELWNGRAEQNG